MTEYERIISKIIDLPLQYFKIVNNYTKIQVLSNALFYRQFLLLGDIQKLLLANRNESISIIIRSIIDGFIDMKFIEHDNNNAKYLWLKYCKEKIKELNLRLDKNSLIYIEDVKSRDKAKNELSDLEEKVALLKQNGYVNEYPQYKKFKLCGLEAYHKTYYQLLNQDSHGNILSLQRNIFDLTEDGVIGIGTRTVIEEKPFEINLNMAIRLYILSSECLRKILKSEMCEIVEEMIDIYNREVSGDKILKEEIIEKC